MSEQEPFIPDAEQLSRRERIARALGDLWELMNHTHSVFSGKRTVRQEINGGIEALEQHANHTQD